MTETSLTESRTEVQSLQEELAKLKEAMEQGFINDTIPNTEEKEELRFDDTEDICYHV